MSNKKTYARNNIWVIAIGLFLTAAVSGEELLLQLSSVKERNGGRWPSMSIVRFDAPSNENAPEYRTVLSDLFLTFGLVVGENNVVYLVETM